MKGKEDIIDISFKNKEIHPSREDGKKILYDLYCETSDHCHIIVEMQSFIQPFFVNRALFYTSASLVGQVSGEVNGNIRSNPSTESSSSTSICRIFR